MEHQGDFLHLLKEAGYQLPHAEPPGAPAHAHVPETHGTTVIAIRYDCGVLNVGDRRATADNMVMYDRADKIFALDDYTLLEVSGSYARAMDIVRFLKHSFKYYRRTQLQDISIEGKVQEVSRAIANNLPSAMQGIGAFLPIMSAYDLRAAEGRIFFYDGMGARFENKDFGAAGSGSTQIRGAFDYIIKTKGHFRQMNLEQALSEALVLLDIAASLDAFTAGYDKILPLVKTVSAEGITTIADDYLRDIIGRISQYPSLIATGYAH